MDIVWKFTLTIFQLKMTLLNWVIQYIKIDSFSHILVFCFGVTFVLLVSLTSVKWRITVLRDVSQLFQFPIITDICIYICAILYSFSLLWISSPILIWKWTPLLKNWKNLFPLCLQMRLQNLPCKVCKIKVVNELWNSWRYLLANWNKGPIIRWVL